MTPAVLPALRALVQGRADIDVAAMPPRAVEHALRAGLGPILAHVASSRPGATHHYRDEIRAADLTSRLLMAEKLDLLQEVLRGAHAFGVRPLLLKGAATSMRYYPKPHLRTMGDLDLLVTADEQPALEHTLRAIGLVQTSHEPPGSFVRRHHSMPFVHPQRQVWFEVHTAVIPRQYALAGSALFAPDAVAAAAVPIRIGDVEARAMGHEMQLVYSSARWSEAFDSARGVYPVLDVALLLRTHGQVLDWDRVLRMVDGSWATTGLRLMLSFLTVSDLATVPAGVLSWLVTHDRHLTRYAAATLHRLAADYMLEGRPFGRVVTTPEAVLTLWQALVRPSTPLRNLVRVPYSLGGTFLRAGVPRRWRRR